LNLPLSVRVVPVSTADSGARLASALRLVLLAAAKADQVAESDMPIVRETTRQEANNGR
jgi:hypothetical protein